MHIQNGEQDACPVLAPLTTKNSHAVRGQERQGPDKPGAMGWHGVANATPG